MFSRRRNLDGSRKYSREFFETLVGNLRRAAFGKIEIKLPHNLVGVDHSIISPEELLKRERNYPSLILVAANNEREETLKLLFVNRSSKTVFVDDTFPSGQSEPPALYFQSPDPGRTFSVFEFFYEYMTRPTLAGYRLLLLSSVAAGLALASEALALVYTGRGAVTGRLQQSALWDVVVSIVSLIVLFRFFAEPKGLWIKPSRELRLMQLANMALRGELRDNPLVSLVVAVLGIVIATLILKWLRVIP